MNSRFKFRVYLPDEKRYLHNTDCPAIDSSGKLMWCYLNPFGHWKHYPMENAVIEQCTGLKDKNGKLIYEGDIVKPTDPEFMGLYKVEWVETYGFAFQKVNGYPSQKFYYLHSDDVKIVGNIHEEKQK